MAPELDELFLVDGPEPWRAAGFDSDGDTVEVGSVRLRLGRPGKRGIVGWSLRGTAARELDGLDTHVSTAQPADGDPHPNGVVSIDHLVVMSPDLDRTVAALEAAGFELRRLREGDTPGGSFRQAFFRMAEVILEVVEAPAELGLSAGGPARLWGISFLVEDLEATAASLGDLLGSPRDAVQPGRRIATLRREAGIGTAVPFMSPGPGAA